MQVKMRWYNFYATKISYKCVVRYNAWCLLSISNGWSHLFGDKNPSYAMLVCSIFSTFIDSKRDVIRCSLTTLQTHWIAVCVSVEYATNWYYISKIFVAKRMISSFAYREPTSCIRILTLHFDLTTHL